MPLADALPSSIVHFSKSRRAAHPPFPLLVHILPTDSRTDRPTALEGFASVRGTFGRGRERNERAIAFAEQQMDGSASLALAPPPPRASSSPIHFSDFLRLIGERERGWSGQWNGGSMKLEIPFRAASCVHAFLSALPASENHGRGRSAE